MKKGKLGDIKGWGVGARMNTLGTKSGLGRLKVYVRLPLVTSAYSHNIIMHSAAATLLLGSK
jgi:hypothetical protein